MRPVLVSALILAALCGCSALTPAPLERTDSLRLWYPGAATVQVVGDWNEWGGLTAAGGVLDPAAGLMEEDGDGFWTTGITLERGRYRYAFLVDGFIWTPDESNHLRAEFEGHEVSVMVIGG